MRLDGIHKRRTRRVMNVLMVCPLLDNSLVRLVGFTGQPLPCHTPGRDECSNNSDRSFHRYFTCASSQARTFCLALSKRRS